mgnify:FL=1
MLAFSEPQYFSRTFPIYQLTNSDKLERSITTYELSPSMENRPLETKEKLSVRFFPEGGQLVEGVTSQVAFKAESKDEGNINDLYQRRSRNLFFRDFARWNGAF